MNDFFNSLPGPEVLLAKHKPGKDIPEVNTHLHSPYSFCGFSSIVQMFDLAHEEKVDVLGINDFYTVDGFAEFEKNALRTRVFPLFNIEFMGLMKDLQEKDIRVNDPNNPGRVYFSGKALRHPVELSNKGQVFLSELQENTQEQVRQMCEKTNVLLKEAGAPFGITYEDVKDKYAENLVRERHIARAIREAAEKQYTRLSLREDFYLNLFDGRELNASFNNVAGVENEIRAVLLKNGGRAFVPEDNSAFPPLSRIIEFIKDAGGIPCYPVLLDDKAGNMTKFEGNWEKMHKILQSYGVSCLELIPMRNSLQNLEDFVEFFRHKPYVISFGTEHNTPELFPVEVKVEVKHQLTPELKKISYQGACVLAAHQYLHARGEEGFVNDGTNDTENMEFYQDLGDALIRKFTNPGS